jgi:5-formyltetrahydrofolate cyclo-ligase
MYEKGDADDPRVSADGIRTTFSLRIMPGHHGFIPSSAEDVLRRRMKIELRKRMRGLRSAMPAAARAERSEKIVDRVLGMDVAVRSRGTALFWPIERHAEVDLRRLDTTLRERGVRVAYPYIDPATQTMTFRFVADPSSMKPHALGHLEPSADDAEAMPDQLDLIIVPALAIDPRGHRVGYGEGYYDKTLARFDPPAVTAGVAFDFQLVAELPHTSGDVAVRWVVTDARAFPAERETD